LAPKRGQSGAAQATADAWAAETFALIAEVASGRRAAKAAATPFFAITRGPTGVST
jgi:hypothetical protein